MKGYEKLCAAFKNNLMGRAAALKFKAAQSLLILASFNPLQYLIIT